MLPPGGCRYEVLQGCRMQGPPRQSPCNGTSSSIGRIASSNRERSCPRCKVSIPFVQRQPQISHCRRNPKHINEYGYECITFIHVLGGNVHQATRPSGHEQRDHWSQCAALTNDSYVAAIQMSRLTDHGDSISHYEF